ncbi:hypothetical protein [Dermacoccus sp. GAS27A]|uniref:hypothetical protein n=1 Tax=Dermacoccus sp. GAS27A TaxID=3156270 RepID=UPI0038326897
MDATDTGSMAATYVFDRDKLVDWTIKGGPHTLASALRLDAYLRDTTKRGRARVEA